MFFGIKKSIALSLAFVGITSVLISFQNCSNVKFAKVTDQAIFSSLAPATLKCAGPIVPCETDRFVGQQTCAETPDGPQYGTCTFLNCKSPFELISGICQSKTCSNGTSEACTFQGATGLRFCDNNNWGSCKWIKISVNSLPEITLSQGLSYNFEVRTSDSSVLLATNKVATLSRVTGTCSNLNSVIDPWLLSAGPFNIGSNILDYNSTVANDIGNCDWIGRVYSNISGISASINISAKKTTAPPSGCVNGANNPPLCNVCPIATPNLINGQCVANCTNGATNPPTCTQFTACTNGANNPPLCNVCPIATPNLVNGQCVANCTNGATNPPTCTQFTACANGANNPPTCTTCPAAKPNLVNAQCVANCTNGATNPPTCTQFPACTNGATNPPTCNSCPVAKPNLVNGQCVANCTNGATNPPTCSSCPTSAPNLVNGQCAANCTNGATNPPTCTSCPAAKPNLANGQCIANCTNGATNPPTCNSCPTSAPNLVNGQCVANCGNGATNPPTCTQFLPCGNGATNPPSCNACSTGLKLNSNSTACIPVMPTFSCTQSVYQCGDTVSCSGSSFDQNLLGCDPTGCYPLNGRPNWSYLGGGLFSFNWANQNTNTSDAPQNWFARNSNGDSSHMDVNIKPCVSPTCSNTAGNYPSCTDCSNTGKVYVNGLCVSPCTNSPAGRQPQNPPTCTACISPDTYNSSNGKCEPECQPLSNSPTLCNVVEVCQNGQTASFGVGTPTVYVNIHGRIGDSVLISNSVISFTDSSLRVTRWDNTMYFRCEAPGNWRQTSDGFCEVQRTIPDSDARCVPPVSFDGGG